jgi:hypothetical protein
MHVLPPSFDGPFTWTAPGKPNRYDLAVHSSDAATGLYAGEGAALCRELPAGELTSKLAAEALQRLPSKNK